MIFTRIGRERAGAFTALGATLIIVACSGENIFPSSVGGVLDGGGAPTVDITAPLEGLEVTIGEQLRVTADVNAPQGLTEVTYSGTYVESTGQAYSPASETFGQVAFASVEALLEPILAQVSGGVYIIVTATDAQGSSAADTVMITIN